MRITFLFFCLIAINSFAEGIFIKPTDSAITYSGRISFSNAEVPEFNYSGVRIRTVFEGTSLAVTMKSRRDTNFCYAIIDDTLFVKYAVDTTKRTIELAKNLKKTLHSLEIVKLTESGVGNCMFYGLHIDKGAKLYRSFKKETKLIHFIGNSITCGYGIEVNDANLHFRPVSENCYDAYAMITARALQVDYNLVSRSGIGIYRNYGDVITGTKENMPAIYDRMFYDSAEVKYDFALIKPDVICINLGTNDFSTIGADTVLFSTNYTQFLERLRGYYPLSKIVCLIGPMLNTDVARRLVSSYVAQRKAHGDNEIYFYELSPQGSLGFGADWHPSRLQARKNAQELIDYISSITGWKSIPITQSTDFQVQEVK